MIVLGVILLVVGYWLCRNTYLMCRQYSIIWPSSWAGSSWSLA